MNNKYELSQKETKFLERVNLEISLDFLHVLHLEKTILMKNIKEIKITRSPETIVKKIIRHFKIYLTQDIRPDNYRLIKIYLFNNEQYSYEVKNIDLISTSKIFKKLFDSTYLNNTSINEQTRNKIEKNK